MAAAKIIADGATTFQTVAGEVLHVAIHGTFGGGTIALEQEINDVVYPVLDEGVAITFAAAADIRLNTVAGDKLRLNMSGSTTPAIDFNLAGASLVR